MSCVKFENTNQAWFEMEKERQPAKEQTWTTLRAVKRKFKGEYGHLGYVEDYIQVGSVAFPRENHMQVMNVDPSEIDYNDTNMVGGWITTCTKVKETRYYLATGSYLSRDKSLNGMGIVIEHTAGNKKIWLLNPDFVVQLGLVQKDDVWLRPSEDNIKVVELIRDDTGKPIEIKVKTNILKDYLCAMGMNLYLGKYFSRIEVRETITDISWSDVPLFVSTNPSSRWEGRITAIHQGGTPVGETTSLTKISRTDVDYENDVPEFAPITDENVKVEHFYGVSTGERLYQVQGELWKTDFIEAGKISERVSYDKSECDEQFYFKLDGTKEDINLKNQHQYLWFDSLIINRLLGMHNSTLTWHGHDTADINMNGEYRVTFGINDAQLVNLLAVDVQNLPSWLRKYWLGENVVPNLDPSRELVESQMECKWITTKAPEVRLRDAYKIANQNAMRAHDGEVITPHSNHEQIWQNIHRFRVKDDDTLYSFAKDLWRLLVEKINGHALSNYALPPKNQKVGSIGHLEAVLATQMDDKEARRLAGYFVAINSIRQADAHSGSHDLQRGLDLLGLTDSMSPMSKALQMITKCTETLEAIANFYQNLTDVKA